MNIRTMIPNKARLAKAFTGKVMKPAELVVTDCKNRLIATRWPSW